MRKSICAAMCVAIAIICFVMGIILGLVETTKDNYVSEYPDNCEYYTHNIYKTEDGIMLTKIVEDGKTKVVVVTEEVFSTMMKYDVDFLTAHRMSR